jgi:hypothetical protein
MTAPTAVANSVAPPADAKVLRLTGSVTTSPPVLLDAAVAADPLRSDPTHISNASLCASAGPHTAVLSSCESSNSDSVTNPVGVKGGNVKAGKGKSKSKGKGPSGKHLGLHFKRIEVGLEDDNKFKVVKRLIGPKGKTMQEVSKESGGSKIWIVGKGSRSWEDDEGPLTICVSAPSSAMLDIADRRISDIVRNIRSQYAAYYAADNASTGSCNSDEAAEAPVSPSLVYPCNAAKIAKASSPLPETSTPDTNPPAAPAYVVSSTEASDAAGYMSTRDLAVRKGPQCFAPFYVDVSCLQSFSPFELAQLISVM